MDHSFSGVVEYHGRSYRFLRPGRRQRDPSADEWGDSRRVRYGNLVSGPMRDRAAAAATVERQLREVRAGDASQTECAVCLQDYDDAEETVSAMPVCGHAFHHHCISEWLSRNAVCPLCRGELPPPTQEEEQRQKREDDEVDENGVRRSLNWVRVAISEPAPGLYREDTLAVWSAIGGVM